MRFSCFQTGVQQSLHHLGSMTKHGHNTWDGMQARAVQTADELAAQKDALQVELDAVRQEMLNAKEQLVEQQVETCPHTMTIQTKYI